MHPRLLLRLAILLPALGAGIAERARAQDEVERIAELRQARDDADPERIAELAALGTPAALDGLLELYDGVGSLYVKREILRALPAFDGIAETEQRAGQKLSDVATESADRELRMAAIEALGQCPRLGRGFLARIVESTAADELREAAMDRHLALAEPEDADWYRKIYSTPAVPQEEDGAKEKKAERKKREQSGEPPVRKQFNLETLREKAFVHVVTQLSDDELVAALRDGHPPIRSGALEELHRRGWKDLEEIARRVFESTSETPQNRAFAAEILVRVRGTDEAADLIDVGQKFATPEFLRERLAELVANMRDPATDKKVARLLGKGKPYEKRFALMAAVSSQEKSVAEDVRKALEDEDPGVVRCAIEVLAARKDHAALDALIALTGTTQDHQTLTLVLETVGKVAGPDPAWDEKLRAWVASAAAPVRNAALKQLARRIGEGARDLLIASLDHADWSTRLAAMRALAAMRQPWVVGPIVERMAKEEGRMLLDFADALWSLTGQSFGMQADRWKAWWERNAEGFQVVDADVLARNQAAAEAWRLKQTTYVRGQGEAGQTSARPDFFGLRIVTRRVAFVLDVSGSMAFDLRTEYEGEKPEPRLAVALRELERCIDALEEGALFNIVTFSGDVASWLDDVASSSGRTRAEAKEYLSRLGAFGGTNIYDALELAFEDPQVDTIYLLSDGEPSAGSIVDPYLIREAIARLNENRGVVIHTIAVGGTLQILEWLAEDSGGSHVKFQ